jgi:hypothetical protein
MASRPPRALHAFAALKHRERLQRSHMFLGPRPQHYDPIPVVHLGVAVVIAVSRPWCKVQRRN